MASSKKCNYIAIIQNIGAVALHLKQELPDAYIGSIYTFGRNETNTNWIFKAVPLFANPKIYKTAIILIEEMPEELNNAFKTFLG